MTTDDVSATPSMDRSRAAHDADRALLDAMLDAARAIALTHFRTFPDVAMKQDASPVTRADRDIEAHLHAMLAENAPRDGVLGEEMAPVGLERARLWVIDPIDGTGAFATGSPLFGVLVALVEGGVPVLGAIDACATGERWVARRGAGATLDGRRCRTSGRRTLAEASVAATALHAFAPGDRASFERVGAAAAITRLGGDCYAYGLVAAGHLDAVIETDLKPYDYMALIPVIEEAGGVITDWNGAALTLQSDGRVIAAASAALHAEIRARLGAP